MDQTINNLRQALSDQLDINQAQALELAKNRLIAKDRLKNLMRTKEAYEEIKSQYEALKKDSPPVNCECRAV